MSAFYNRALHPLREWINQISDKERLADMPLIWPLHCRWTNAHKNNIHAARHTAEFPQNEREHNWRPNQTALTLWWWPQSVRQQQCQCWSIHIAKGKLRVEHDEFVKFCNHRIDLSDNHYWFEVGPPATEAKTPRVELDDICQTGWIGREFRLGAIRQQGQRRLWSFAIKSYQMVISSLVFSIHTQQLQSIVCECTKVNYETKQKPRFFHFAFHT